MTRLFLTAIAAVLLLSLHPARAGEPYKGNDVYANSGYDVVAYFDLPQSPIGSPQPPAVPGSARFTAEHNGATYAFSSAENLARFQADPDRYLPMFDGHCAYGIAKGGKAPGNPNLWRIVDGRLYLNVTQSVARDWEEDIAEYLEEAADNWTDLERDPASDRSIPDFTSSAPLP